MPKSRQRKTTSSKAGKKQAAPTSAQGALPRVEEGKRILLHIGCGLKHDSKLPPFFDDKNWQEVRVDINPDVEPDIVADMLDMQAIPDNYADGLYSSHNLEHIYNYQVPTALNEFYRVLKPGGQAMLTMPDIQAVAFQVAGGLWDQELYGSPAGSVTPRDIFYGHEPQLAKGKHYMAHKNGFTAHSLGRHLLKSNFSHVEVKRDDGYNLWAVGRKIPRDHKAFNGKAKISASYSLAVVQRSHAGSDPARRTDELDREPKRWQAPQL
jgi:SAM-dependent methyltransferase